MERAEAFPDLLLHQRLERAAVVGVVRVHQPAARAREPVGHLDEQRQGKGSLGFHLHRARRREARVRLLGVLARLEPPADQRRVFDLETDVLCLYHRERDRVVKEAFGEVLFRHSPWMRFLWCQPPDDPEDD